MADTKAKMRIKLIRVGLCGCDILLTALAALGAYWMLNWHTPQFDWISLPLGFWVLSNVFAVVALCLALGLYSILFSSVGFPETLRTFMVSVIMGAGNVLFVLIMHLAEVPNTIGYSVVLFFTVILFIGLTGLRFAKP